MTGSSHFFTSVTFQSPATTTCFLFTDNLYNIFYHSVLDTVERLLPKAWNTLKIVYHLQGFLLLHCAIRWLSFYRRRIYHLWNCGYVCVLKNQGELENEWEDFCNNIQNEGGLKEQKCISAQRKTGVLNRQTGFSLKEMGFWKVFNSIFIRLYGWFFVLY